MAYILAVGTATPPYAMTQDDVRQLAQQHFAGKLANADKYLRVFGNANVHRRYFCVPADWFRDRHPLQEKNRLYLDWAQRLCVDAVRRCLAKGDVDPLDIDHVVFVSSSGIATPSIEVGIINALGLRPDVRRTPIFGLGCAGGAGGIALCADLLPRGSAKTVLLVAVELNSLTFQHDDFSKENLVAASLFGDGAAAVVIRSTAADSRCLRVLKSASLLRGGTTSVMGWDFVDTGFRVVFSTSVPQMIADMIADSLARVLAGTDIALKDIAMFIFHPGGTKILKAYETVLAMGPERFAESYGVLRSYGNMSSATVLFVLEQAMQNGGRQPGDCALLAAFGPGFSANMSLLQWS